MIRRFRAVGSEALARGFFFVGLVTLSVLYGYVSSVRRWFPYPQLENARNTYHTLRAPPVYYFPAPMVKPLGPTARSKAQDGLNLVTAIVANDELSIRLMDLDGHVVHE